MFVIGGRTRIAKAFAGALILAVFSFSAPPVAATGPYGYDGIYWYPDNANLTYCIQPSIPEDSHYRIHDSMAYVDASTSMYDTFSGTCWLDTDAKVQYSSAGDNFGLTTCYATPGFGLCDRWTVEINEPLILGLSTPGKEDFNITHIVRHEIGHTTGQHHPNSSANAMTNGINQPISSSYYVYLSHERTCHINRFVTGQALC